MEICCRKWLLVTLCLFLAAGSRGAITASDETVYDVVGDDAWTSVRAVCDLPDKVDVAITIDINRSHGTELDKMKRFATSIINYFEGPATAGTQKNYSLSFFDDRSSYSYGFGGSARKAKEFLTAWTSTGFRSSNLLSGLEIGVEELKRGSAKDKVLFILTDGNAGETGATQFSRYIKAFRYNIVTIAVGSSPKSGLLKSIASNDNRGNPLFNLGVRAANAPTISAKVLRQVCAGSSNPTPEPAPTCDLPSKLSICFAIDRGVGHSATSAKDSEFVLAAIDTVERLATRRSVQYTTVQYGDTVDSIESYTDDAWWAQRSVAAIDRHDFRDGNLMVGFEGCVSHQLKYAVGREKMIVLVSDGLYDTSLATQYAKHYGTHGFTIATAAIGESRAGALLKEIASDDVMDKPLFVSDATPANANALMTKLLRKVCAGAATPTPKPAPLCNLPPEMTVCFAIDRGTDATAFAVEENNFVISAIDSMEKLASRRSKFYVVTDYADVEQQWAQFLDGNPLSAQYHIRQWNQRSIRVSNLQAMLQNCAERMSNLSLGRKKIIYMLSNALNGAAGAKETARFYKDNGYTIVSVGVGTNSNPSTLKSIASNGTDGRPLYATTSGANAVTNRLVRKLCRPEPRPTPTPAPVCNLPPSMNICFAMDRGFNAREHIIEANEYVIAAIDAMEKQATRRDKIYTVVDYHTEEYFSSWAKNNAWLIQNHLASSTWSSFREGNLLVGMNLCAERLQNQIGDHANVMFVLTDGTQGTTGVEAYARFLRSTGTRIVTVGLGLSPNRSFLRSIASKDVDGVQMYSPGGLSRNAKLLTERLFERIC